MNYKQIAGFASIYFFCKGMAGTLLRLCLLPLFKETYNVDSLQFQKYCLIIMLPWSLKPVIALLSDSFGIARLLVCVIAIVGCAAGAALSFASTESTAVALTFLCSAEIAFIDILAEGEYANIMSTAADKAAKHSVVSLVWAMLLIGQLCSSLLSGVVDTSKLVVLLAFLLIMPLLPASVKWLFAPRDTQFWMPGAKLGIFLTIAALLLVPVTIKSNNFIKLGYVTTIGTLLVSSAFFILPFKLAKANAYMFATSILYLNVSGAVDYWFTASTHCVPGGPNFSMKYYIAAGAAVSSLFAAIGVGIFNKFFKNITNYRHMFWITASVRILAASTDIVLLNRWNLNVGIPDKVMYLLGDGALQSLAAALEFMPLVLLTSELAAGGAESTTYAILAGYQNFGSAISTTYGYVMQDTLGVTFHENNCNADNIAWLVGFAHMVLPLATIPLSFCLIDA